MTAHLSSLMKFSDESKYYPELAPFFVNDPLNKDSFVIPPPNLTYASSETSIGTAGNATSANKTTANKPVNDSASKIDLFDNYVELLTEILIRLPYQMKKLCLGNQTSSAPAATADSGATPTTTTPTTGSHQSHYQQILNQIATTAFDFAPWTHYLCEYLQLGPSCYYLKRLIKKLLQILCSSKDKYRKFKDQHILTECTQQLTRLCPLKSAPVPQSLLNMGHTLQECMDAISTCNPSNITNSTTLSMGANSNVTVSLAKMSYLSLLRVTEQLKQMVEIASARTANWHRFVLHNPRMIVYLCELAMLMGVDANGSGSDSSYLNGLSSIATACTTTSPLLIPTILQLLILTLGMFLEKICFVCN